MKYKLKLDIPIWCSVLKALDGAWQICEKSARDMLIVLLAVPSINWYFRKTHFFKCAYKTVIVVQHLVYPCLSIPQDEIFSNFNFLHQKAHLHGRTTRRPSRPRSGSRSSPRPLMKRSRRRHESNHWRPMNWWSFRRLVDWLFVFKQ